MKNRFPPLVAFAACLALGGVVRAALPPIRIVLAGDSTVTESGGWGPGFRVSLRTEAECVNLSSAGQSSKSYLDQGRWGKILATKGNFVLIQFGHNDVPGKGPARETDAATSFRANLKRFVAEARAAGMSPVLVTSICHRNFGPDGKLLPDGLEPYVAATRAVATEESAPLIDLYALSRRQCEQIGPEAAARLGRMLTGTKGLAALDTTHLGPAGALAEGKLVAGELARVVPALAPYLREEPAGDAPVAAANRWERQAREKSALTAGAAWFYHEPLAFLIRRGGAPANAREIYALQHEPENIRRLASVAPTYAGMIHFYKGMGLAAEGAEIAAAGKAAEIAHQYGMKVCFYMAGTMFTETLYREIPAARDWEQRDGQGRPIPYVQTQSYRHYACPNEPAYRDYLKRALKIAVRDFHADEIMFDNVMLQPEPESCQCGRCQAAFTAFLRARYPDARSAFDRFGLTDVDGIRPPEWDNPATPDSIRSVDDPVLQEWIRFRCESLANNEGELYRYVKELNPRVAVGFNLKGVFSFNRIWTNGVYHPLYAGHCDIVALDTGGYDAGLDPASGALVSQIRSFKLARQLGMSVEDGLGDDLKAAVYMAFNYEKPMPSAGVQGGPSMIGGENVFSPLLEFFRAYNDRYFTNVTPIADVAVLRTWASSAYSIGANYVPLTLVEQTLIQHHVLFDELPEEQMDRLERYAAIILAGQEDLSAPQVERLLAYAGAGGTLVVVGNSGACDQWHRLRAQNPLLPARALGKGRIVAIERVLASQPGRNEGGGGAEVEGNGGLEPRNARFSPRQWVLPQNHAQIFAALGQGVARGLSLTTDAPLTTVVEALQRPESRETLLHVINFDRRHAAVASEVALQRQYGGPVTGVQCFDPDRDDPVPLPYTEEGGKVHFRVPANRLYQLIVISEGKRSAPLAVPEGP